MIRTSKYPIALLLFLICSFTFTNLEAQNDEKTTEMSQIVATLNDYIQGSTNGQPERLKKAFHPNLNLYYVRNDSIKAWSGQDYIADTKAGQPTGELGKIITIDYENEIAIAKVQIAHPESKMPYIDYFMLAKAQGQWTIIHKMFTKRIN
ncbi:MAG: nuclear transport factor 2 family protein [Bacteroidota bacterium]